MLGGEKYPQLEKEHAPKLESYCGGLTLFSWHESRIAPFVSDPVSCHISSVPSEDCSRSHACLASWYLSCYRCGPIPNWKRSESSPLLPILWQFGGGEHVHELHTVLSLTDGPMFGVRLTRNQHQRLFILWYFVNKKKPGTLVYTQNRSLFHVQVFNQIFQ